MHSKLRVTHIKDFTKHVGGSVHRVTILSLAKALEFKVRSRYDPRDVLHMRLNRVTFDSGMYLSSKGTATTGRFLYEASTAISCTDLLSGVYSVIYRQLATGTSDTLISHSHAQLVHDFMAGTKFKDIHTHLCNIYSQR